MIPEHFFTGGPLAFPVTPFKRDGELDLQTFERFAAWLVSHGTPALFVGCGTGEIASFDVDEIASLVKIAKSVASGQSAVIAGAGQGLQVAKRTIRAAADAGADAALVLPPYLITPEQNGLHDYYSELASTTDLPLILYQRDNARFDPETLSRLTQHSTIAGFKDGLGDVELIQRIVTIVGDRLQYFNGMPTAETFQAAYAGLRVPNYSSAVYNFVPEVSTAFYRAAQSDDLEVQQTLLREFFVPLAKLRGQVRGYAVSLVKAGVRLRWGDVGRVRPPLVEARADHVDELATLIDRAIEILA